ncbi:MAG TPA: hypothetical protein GX507_11665 [Clostridia bacterium]|nr:hypothetical protein [Clostridia bacterium]
MRKSRSSPGYKVMKDEEVIRIHESALKVLEKTGVFVDCDEAIDLLGAAGAQVNRGTKIVRFPKNLVEQALAACPCEFSLFNREGDEEYPLDDAALYFDPGSCGVNVLDASGQVRSSTGQDLTRIAKLCDALPHFAFNSTAVYASEAPKVVGDSYRVYLVLKNSSKPVITGAFSIEGVKDMLDLLCAVCGGEEQVRTKPRAVFDVCPSPALKWTEISAKNIIDCARLGLPVELISMPMPGAASPATLAGSIVQHTAESLSGIVLAQVASPGAKVIWGGAPVVFEMRYGTTPASAVEAAMMGAATAQIGRFYGLPTHTYAALSDSKAVDVQAGLESALSGLIAALGGNTIISGPGMVEFIRTVSLEKLLIDHEIAGMIKRLVKGITMNDETLAVDVLASLGPGGDFLTADHTLRWCRKEIHVPGPVIDRRDRQAWSAEGSKDALTKAKEEVDRILAEHTPRPLSPEREAALDEVMKEIAARHGVPWK